MAVVTRWDDAVAELASGKLSGTLVDLDGVGFKPTALTAEIYDAATRDVIRAKASVLDVNGGTVDADGNLELELTPANNAIVGHRREERHILLLEWTWDAATKAGKHEVHFTVRNLDRVP